MPVNQQDIVERLRKSSKLFRPEEHEAADEIERLRAELEAGKSEREITLGAMCVIEGRCRSGELKEQLIATTHQRDIYQESAENWKEHYDDLRVEIERLRIMIAEQGRVIDKYRAALEYVTSHHDKSWDSGARRIANEALNCKCDEHGACAWCMGGRK